VAKIVIAYEYEPSLEHYPDSVKTQADAMRFDVQQIEDNHISLGEFLDMVDDNKVTIEVVE
jgi:hypothetical protein